MQKTDEKITGMNINASAISTSVNMPVCTSMEVIQVAAHEDAHLQKLRSYIIQGWPHKKDQLEQEMRCYWPIGSELAMTDATAIKGKK